MMMINGVQTDKLDALDRGLMYGDGVFRTMVMRNSSVFWWDIQYKKLQDDCAALGITCPGKECLESELAVLTAQTPECVIKIVVTRGVGLRGYTANLAQQPTRILSTSPLPGFPAEYIDKGVKVRVCDLRLSYQPRLAGIKHLNRLENVLARTEWTDAEIAEGLLLDARDNVISGTMSNISLLKEGVFITPDLSLCGIAGVARQRIMEIVAGWGWRIRIQPVSLSMLIEAEEVLLSNSVIGVWQITELQEKIWQPGNLTKKIRCVLHESH
ncbi:aminodeoxychorismate lyase [Sulfurirhabdus autotrophica]|uniref:aminodeoxychorismate lyase n=1 Tax=Sulfurirhabdus autotrophica TaxID=1706046 RepID=A0A4R3YDT9_9PROT|nr:aminodeoxychorismate lyase [Sulfurirhabdus autotrophica]TCV90071.1 4-amino-4-deoxychorismate lyase [Sulfurirhabdus autotrophica]